MCSGSADLSQYPGGIVDATVHSLVRSVILLEVFSSLVVTWHFLVFWLAGTITSHRDLPETVYCFPPIELCREYMFLL